LWWLQEHTWRFAELRRQIPGITEKMLTQQLRELEADGIGDRRVYATAPPKVEYSFTEYGRSLKLAWKPNADGHEFYGCNTSNPERCVLPSGLTESSLAGSARQSPHHDTPPCRTVTCMVLLLTWPFAGD
jgi:hypothetical protein